MGRIELLAPAGDRESLYAAVQSGADAVYVGGSRFSARAYASNFDEKSIVEAIDYCHLYNVKIYATINTLIKETELKEAVENARFLYEHGIDAVIVQDTGLAFLIRSILPNLEIHASTQMTVHNGKGAQFLNSRGFKRIVLARELSAEETKCISKDLGVETEIFIHGALCICYSGQCLMSSIIGGRSGNRGRCAQPCRLPYALIDMRDNSETSAYLLSPKDISTINEIRELINCGVASLKIEGRMKRPEYVAGVTQAYRRAIDNENRKHLKKDNKVLEQLFNREGFSKAYLFGNTGRDMMAFTNPKNTGVQLGKAERDLTIKLLENVSINDGIRVGEEGFSVSKILKNNNEVDEAFSGESVRLFPSNYKNGDVLFKTSSSLLNNELKLSYQNPYDKKVLIKLIVAFQVGKPLTLRTEYMGREFIYEGDTVALAEKKPIDKEKLEENLRKSGDTPFKIKEVEYISFEPGFLPVSAINSARRELIQKIEDYIINKSKGKRIEALKLPESSAKDSPARLPKTMVCVNTKEQLRAAMDCKIGNIAVNLFMRKDGLTLKDLSSYENEKFYLRVPNIIRSEYKHISDIIWKTKDQLKGIVTANLGVISEFGQSMPIIGDYKLNVFNSQAMSFFDNNLIGTCISAELNKREIGELAKNNNSLYQVLVYGKIELMVSEYCPIGSTIGGKTESRECSGACSISTYLLKDRKGERFLVSNDLYCRSYIYNKVPLNLINNLKELESVNVSSFRLDFIDENYDETVEVLKAYSDRKMVIDGENYTKGHFKRGVE